MKMESGYMTKITDVDSDTKLAITKWVMKHIVEHAKEGGSYRYLIYTRLGFGPEAYGELLDDGMVISNEFDLELRENVGRHLAAGNIAEAKKTLGFCDAPDCYISVTSIWQDSTGTRATCSKHYQGILKKDLTE